jgi:hypothetical protein
LDWGAAYLPLTIQFQTQEKIMNTPINAMRKAVLLLLVLITVPSLVGVSVAADRKAKPPITIAQLAGPWQIALVGNAGCGATSLQFTGTLNSSGHANGTLTTSSGCGVDLQSAETFDVKTLNSNGSGTAGLSCGNGCGWNFLIQVAPSRQVFNLVDVTDPVANFLAGTAVKQ